MDELKLEDIVENIAIIKLTDSYRKNMSPLELYDVTRGCWKRKLDSVKDSNIVLAVNKGQVVEVYKVYEWVEAKNLHRETIPFDAEVEKGRVGFNGVVADEKTRDKYIGKYVNGLYKRGEISPIKTIAAQVVRADINGNINTPIKPIGVSILNGETKVICPRCKTAFLKATRCPECGQLMTYADLEDDNRIFTID